MRGDIKINCKHVYDVGEKYLKISDELIELQKRLDKISVDILKVWKGPDGNNFLVSFNEHIKSLDPVINFLGGNSEILKTVALDHSGIDTTMAKNIERSDLDDRQRNA